MNKRRTIRPRWKKFWIIFLGTVATIGFAVSSYAFLGVFTVKMPESTVSSVSVNNSVETVISTDNSESVSQNPSSQNQSSQNQPTLFSRANRSSGCNSTNGEPVDNPIASVYGKDAYPWTNQLRWDCVYNINNFSGSSLIEKFNKARDAAAANGGGVVYFPAGT